MQIANVVDALTAETVLRVARNSITKTTTITAGTIAVGSPVVLATGTASINGTWVQIPATATSIVNNGYIGNLAKAPGTVGYLMPEDIGLVQCYGYDADARIQTASVGAGGLLIPQSDQSLIFVVNPNTGATTAAPGCPAIGGLAFAIGNIASSSAVRAGGCFVRAM